MALAPGEVGAWVGSEPPEARCAWQHTDGPPVYRSEGPCAPVSAEVGRLVQSWTVGRADASKPDCCLQYAEVMPPEETPRRAGRVAFGAGREQLALVQDRSAALVDLEVTPDGTWREAAPRGAAGDGAASQADVWPALWRTP